MIKIYILGVRSELVYEKRYMSISDFPVPSTMKLVRNRFGDELFEKFQEKEEHSYWKVTRLLAGLQHMRNNNLSFLVTFSQFPR